MTHFPRRFLAQKTGPAVGGCDEQPALWGLPYALLGLYRRAQSVARVLAGQRVAGVAGAFGGSVWDVRQWQARFRAGGRAFKPRKRARPRGRTAGRNGGQGDRASARELADDGGGCRRDLGLARSTVTRRLARRFWPAGPDRPAGTRAPVPVLWQGELIYLDIKGVRSPRRSRPTCDGQSCDGQPTRPQQGRRPGSRHVAVAGATRRAFAGVPGDARKTTTTAFLLGALRWIRCHGIGAERVMTDAGWLSLHGLAVSSQEVVQLKRG